MTNQKQPPIFGLAPMEGVSELPFRLWISQTSAPAFACTPFLRATDSYPKSLPFDFAPELDTYRELVNYRLIPQVMASRPEDFVRTAKLFLERTEFVDLNAGCPSPNPISGGAGSALLREPLRFAQFMRELADQLPTGSFSLKMRTGFEDTSEFFSYIEALREIPLRRLTIHGRTRRDRYDHASRWDLIEAAAYLLPIPVVASGDIVSHASWQERSHHASLLHEVIVGRGALRNPWIFSELQTGEAQVISIDLLKHSMACLGLWLEAHHMDMPALDQLIRSGCFRHTCGTDLLAWQELYARSVRTLRGSQLAIEDLHFERAIIGRIKMVWNSLRSSLPPPFFSPILLRASAFRDWLNAWSDMWESSHPLPVTHCPDLDWLYTSSRQRLMAEQKQANASVSVESPDVTISKN